jgi:hypothetical protein
MIESIKNNSWATASLPDNLYAWCNT